MTLNQLRKAFELEGPVSITRDLARIARERSTNFARCSDQDSATHWQTVAQLLDGCARDMTATA